MDAGYSLKTDGKIPDCGRLIAVLALMPLALRIRALYLKSRNVLWLQLQ